MHASYIHLVLGGEAVLQERTDLVPALFDLRIQT
jgi:hypothetical protein